VRAPIPCRSPSIATDEPLRAPKVVPEPASFAVCIHVAPLKSKT
jgi:hypothetical protein